LDRFLAFLFGQLGVAPVLEQPVVHPVLVYGSEFQKQCLVKPLDYLLVAFHGSCSCSRIGCAIGERDPGVKRCPRRPPSSVRGTPRLPELSFPPHLGSSRNSDHVCAWRDRPSPAL